MDIFLPLHFVVHFSLAIALRNRLFNWANSIIWEIVENIYTAIPALGFISHAECWFDAVIFDICFANAIGIELGLLVLRYLLKWYPPFFEWKMPFKALCGEKRQCGTFLWWFVVSNLILLLSLTQLTTFALYDHTLELKDADYPSTAGSLISGFRHYLVLWATIPVFKQLYEWMHFEESVRFLSWSFIQKSYWIMLVWAILLTEVLLMFMYYPIIIRNEYVLFFCCIPY